MDEDGITITDPSYREPTNSQLEQELREHEAENMRRAEEKEQAMLEASWQRHLKRAERRKKFVDGIKKIFARKNIEITKQSEQVQR